MNMATAKGPDMTPRLEAFDANGRKTLSVEIDAITSNVRPSVSAFALLMEVRLKERDKERGRYGWRKRKTPADAAFRDLDAARDKLDDALTAAVVDDNFRSASDSEEKLDAVMRQCADVANYAMMIHDLCARQRAAVGKWSNEKPALS